jgi:hypothetical protein
MEDRKNTLTSQDKTSKSSDSSERHSIYPASVRFFDGCEGRGSSLVLEQELCEWLFQGNLGKGNLLGTAREDRRMPCWLAGRRCHGLAHIRVAFHPICLDCLTLRMDRSVPTNQNALDRLLLQKNVSRSNSRALHAPESPPLSIEASNTHH